jgi:putative DNA primase/helicase
MDTPSVIPSLLVSNADTKNQKIPSLKSTVTCSAPSGVEPGSAATQISLDTNSIITVIRDIKNPLGKRFDLNPDGSINKSASVTISQGIATMHHIETHDELAALLTEVGNDPNAAIINASFNGIDVGEEFVILSEREIEKQLGISRADRNKQKGVHQITFDGTSYKAVGRFKENVRPSSWQILDRDIDQHTPAEFAQMSDAEWLSATGKIIPGLERVSYVKAASTSSRVLLDGQPVGAGNGHVWVKVANTLDVERVRTALIVQAANVGMVWTKPRYSSKEPGAVVGKSLTTIVDPSVWTPGRLVFIGKPVVSDGLTVKPLSATVHKGENDTLDTAAIVLPDAATVRQITRKAGVEMDVQVNGNGLRISTHDLTLDAEIDTEDHGLLTVRQISEKRLAGKIRCQSPFRDSNSFAAFMNFGVDGTPFIFDVGTGITHWLNEFEAEELLLVNASGVLKSGVCKAGSGDGGAGIEPEAIRALSVIKKKSPADYQRIRAELKQANSKVSLVAIDTAIKARAIETSTAPTHHGYAQDILERLTVDEWAPVGHVGKLYVVNPASGIWLCKQTEILGRLVAEVHDGKDNCKRSNDYSGIAQHAISIASNDAFFVEAPVGLACPEGFYQIVGNEICVEPLNPAHRQRVMIDVTPKNIPTPLFDAFLHETFQSINDGDEAQQLSLVQEIAGAIMFGVMHKHQKAVLFYDPFGRAGKGTLERILRGLVPPSFVTAVSPFVWHKEYFVASLAGTRLNVVGELSDDEPIPAAMFKTVTGGDLITGRHPTHRPIMFKNEAAHLFMSNHMINTRDHSEAFFARWLIVEFPNSRLRTGLPLDPLLAERIIEHELPGIAQWALEGAIRLMRNGKFSKSVVHDRLMAKWRCSTNSLEEFIQDGCVLGSAFSTRRSDFYQKYAGWCKESGRRPFAKGRVKELLEHNVGLGIVLAEIDGYETFKGVQVKVCDDGDVVNL